MGREYHYLWTYDLEAAPELLWPLVSDTNRFNRDTALPPMQLLGIENRVRHVRFRVPVVNIEWDEEPFEWTYPHRFGILRRYRTGPVAEMRVECRLERRQPSGTRLIYETWARSKNLLGNVAIPIVIGFVSARLFERVFRRYDRFAVRKGNVLTVLKGRRLSQGGHRRYRVLSAELAKQGVDETILTRMYEFVHRADDISIQRIRPYALADAWGLPRRPVLEAFLRAARAGIFDIYWDLLCPECRGVTEGFSRLSNVRAGSHCNTCKIDFTANFDHNVEVIFRPNPLVRSVDANLEFCVGSPQRQPHLLFSMTVPSREELPFMTMLEQGRYNVRAIGLSGSQPLVAASEGTARLDLRASVGGWPYQETKVALIPYIRLINETEQAHTFELARTAWSDQAATAADVTALQVFRDLFSSEVLRPGEDISVGSVTLMFTDLRNSTKLYREIGDAPAFGRVRQHFEMLQRAVAADGGAIVKTMGDSVMSVFRQPAAALRAVRSLQSQLTASGQLKLLIKAGIHQGPCIVVNLDDRLDYFGSTVNVAARLPGFSDGGEVIFSQSVRDDFEVEEFLVQNLPPNSLFRFQADVKGYDQPVGLWRMKI